MVCSVLISVARLQCELCPFSDLWNLQNTQFLSTRFTEILPLILLVFFLLLPHTYYILLLKHVNEKRITYRYHFLRSSAASVPVDISCMSQDSLLCTVPLSVCPRFLTLRAQKLVFRSAFLKTQNLFQCYPIVDSQAASYHRLRFLFSFYILCSLRSENDFVKQSIYIVKRNMFNMQGL